MSVMERIGEIGTSMALGVKRAGIMRLFLSEGCLLGCLGSLFGLIAGIIIGQYDLQYRYSHATPRRVWREVIQDRFSLPGTQRWNHWHSLLVPTVAASIYPAWRASRMQIVDALRHNR